MDELKEQHIKQESRTLEELQAARQAIRDQSIRIANQENNFKQLNNMRKELEHKLETYLLKVNFSWTFKKNKWGLWDCLFF